MSEHAVSISDVRAAADRTRPLVRRTPIWQCGSVNRRAARDVVFKCENLQKGGAFKIRGASNFLFSMSAEDRLRGVVAFSSGNHAQATAIAARHFGVPATIVMPDDAPKSKMAATEANGAKIVVYDRFTGNREEIGRRIASETGATLVPPFDHPWIIAGQGTCALELLEQAPDLDCLAVCLGGGGLLAGCAVAAKALKPSIRIYGVEPEIANDWWLSLKQGEPIAIPPPETIADGLRTQKPGRHTFPIVRDLVDEVVLVTEDEIKETVKFLMSRMKLVVEPSGAVAAAAVLHGRIPPASQTGVVLSGGNVDFETLAAL
jgi:threonine dehydratase